MTNPSASPAVDTLLRGTNRLQSNISSNLAHLIERLQTAKEKLDEGEAYPLTFYGETFARELGSILIDAGKLRGLQDAIGTLEQTEQ